jgi:hypothetical protein
VEDGVTISGDFNAMRLSLQASILERDKLFKLWLDDKHPEFFPDDEVDPEGDPTTAGVWLVIQRVVSGLPLLQGPDALPPHHVDLRDYNDDPPAMKRWHDLVCEFRADTRWCRP